MSYFAMVVVVEAEHPEDAHDTMTGGNIPVQFVGEPWECLPVDSGFVSVDRREWREPRDH